MTLAAMMLTGCLIDLALGWPDGLFRRIGHPVTWIGAAITALERRLNTGTGAQRRRAGALSVALLLAGIGTGTVAVQALLPTGPLGILIGGVLAWPFIAIRSMHAHVRAVALPLSAGDLAGARAAVAMIVGRDPARLDDAGVARAALESLAENTSDGIVAPLFWGVVLGLPGLVLYKVINTLDSMIGHRTPRFEDYGRAAARLDDAANLIPARLTGALFALVSGRAGPAWATMRRDARRHRSPNAGWPEAAMAGALGVRLSGPRHYGDHISAEPWLNETAPDPDAARLNAGLAVYRRAMLALLAALAVLAMV